MNLEKFLRLPALVGLISVNLAGCGFFHTHQADYQKSAEARPLEIPANLDSPSTAGELIVPAAGTSSGKVVTDDVTPPSIEASDTAGAGVSRKEEFTVSDTPANTWQRIGAALERDVQIGKIVARDESNRSYTLEITNTSVVPKSGNWLTRWFHRDQKTTVINRVVVKIAENAGGSRISVEGETGGSLSDSAVARVMAALRERLA